MAGSGRIIRFSRIGLMNGWVVLATIVLSALSNLLTPTGGEQPLVSLQAGLALALTYAKGVSVWPGITTGTFLSNLLFPSQSGVNAAFSIAAAGILALAATLQAYLGGICLRRGWPQLLWFRESEEFRLFYLIVTPLACFTLPIANVVVRLFQDTAAWQALIGLYFFRQWLANVIGGYLIAPILILKWTEEPGFDRKRITRVLIPTVIVALITIIAFLMSQYLAQSDTAQRIRNRTLIARSRLLLKLERHKEFLRGSQMLFMNNQEMSAQEFSLFASIFLDRDDGLKAVSWNPLIGREQIDAFEEQQRINRGIRNFTVSELTADDKRIPVKLRNNYVPIQYIEPMADNYRALGYDISSNYLRADAIRRAKQTGTLQATSAVKLVQSKGHPDSLGVLMLQPIYLNDDAQKGETKYLKGFLVAVYELDTLLKSSFQGEEWKGYHLTLFDHTAGSENQLLATYPGTELLSDHQSQHLGPRNPYPQHRLGIEIGSRQWELQLTDVTANINSLPMSMVIVILQGGLLSTCIMEGFLIWVTGSEQISQRELEKKLRTSLTTAAMAHEIKQPLTSLLLNSKALQRIDQRYWYGRDDELHNLSIQIAKDAQRINRVIGSIRDVLKNSVSRPEILEVNGLLEEAYLLAKGDLLIKQATFEYFPTDKSARIKGDRGQLIMAIKNILKNSAEAIHPSGHVRVSTRLRRNWVDVMICDDGPGFSEDVIKQCHPGLFSTKVGGSGMGLFLCSTAVQNNKGMMRLGRSKLGGGEVVLSFPQVSNHHA